MIRLWIFTAAVCCMLCSPLQAGHCVQRVRVIRHGHVVHKAAFVQHHVAQQAIVYPTYYQVGQGIRDAAVIEHAAERAAELAAAKVLAILKQNGQPGVGPPPDSGGANDMDAVMQGIANASCVRCHGGAKTEAGLTLTNVAALSKEQRLNVGSKTFLGLMPQNAAGEPVPLPDAEANFALKWSQGAAEAADIPGSPTP